jgi:hypothetical protein
MEFQRTIKVVQYNLWGSLDRWGFLVFFGVTISSVCGRNFNAFQRVSGLQLSLLRSLSENHRRWGSRIVVIRF